LIQKVNDILRGKLTSYQWYLGLRFLGSFLAGIILSKSGYLTADIGSYESFLLLASGSSFFWLAGLFNGFLIKRGKVEESQQGLLLFQTLLLNVCFTSLSALALLLLAPSLQVSAHVKVLFLIYLFGNNLAFTLEYHLLIQKKHKALLLWGIVPLLVQALLFFIFAFQSLPVMRFVELISCLALLRGLTSLIWVLKISTWKVDRQLLKEQLLLSSPIALSILAAGSSEYIDAFLAKHFFGNNGLALLRYGARELPFVLIPANALSVSMLPLLSANQSEGMNELKSKASFLFKVSAPLCIILLLSSKWIYPIIFNPAFAASAPIFNILCLLAITRLIFPQTVLSASGKTKWILILSLVEIGCNLVFSLIMLPYFGLSGIAWGTIITAMIENILLMIMVKSLLGISPSSYIDMKAHLSWGIAIIFAFVISLCY
jgi:O-antigen/teichoic acid export membrane protein